MPAAAATPEGSAYSRQQTAACAAPLHTPQEGELVTQEARHIVDSLQAGGLPGVSSCLDQAQVGWGADVEALRGRACRPVVESYNVLDQHVLREEGVAGEWRLTIDRWARFCCGLGEKQVGVGAPLSQAQ